VNHTSYFAICNTASDQYLSRPSKTLISVDYISDWYEKVVKPLKQLVNDRWTPFVFQVDRVQYSSSGLTHVQEATDFYGSILALVRPRLLVATSWAMIWSATTTSCISGCRPNIAKLQRLSPSTSSTFWVKETIMLIEHCQIKPEVRNPRWRPRNPKKSEFDF